MARKDKSIAAIIPWTAQHKNFLLDINLRCDLFCYCLACALHQ
jgi:hypothetical protein